MCRRTNSKVPLFSLKIEMSSSGATLPLSPSDATDLTTVS